MRTRHRTRSYVAAILAALVLGIPPSPPALADLPVIDPAGLVQLGLQWTQEFMQLQAMAQQVEALRAAARQLDPRSYQSVQNLLAGTDVNYEALLRDIRTMGYSLERVNAQYERVFPKEQAVHSMTPAQFEETARGMNDELYASAEVGARAQTTLRTIEDNNREARNVLSRSQGNDSQVAQLQAALQMLGLIHQNLVTINQLVSTGERVTSNVSVHAATTRRIERERAARLSRDYVRDESIPEVDARLLSPW